MTGKEGKGDAAAVDFKWLPLPREYGVESDRLSLSRHATPLHPLNRERRAPSLVPNAALSPLSSPSASSSSPHRKNAPSIADPLGAFAAAAKSPSSAKDDVFDPLRAMASSSLAGREQKEKEAAEDESTHPSSPSHTRSTSSMPGSSAPGSTKVILPPGEGYEPWRDKRARILTKYTTNKRIPVQANFLEEEKVQAPKAVDTAKSRLEELEAEAAEALAASKINMSQKEYIAHIEEQHDRLKQAWEAGERVLSLKIAIQCAKLLGDSSVPQFYPSMYVLLTDILDTFGDLVFERIKSKGVEVVNSATKQKQSHALPANFIYTDVAASAQETCRNWFFKTSCIRELLPRLYIDMCLLKCYRFVDEDSAYPQRFARLSRMIRGVGDPLVATYARAYLATKCGDVWNSFSNDLAKAGAATNIPKIYQPCLVEAFDDFLFTYKALLTPDNIKAIRTVREERLTRDEYIDLFSPALEWLLQNIGYKSSEDLFFALLQQYKDYCNCSAVLVHLLSSFHPSFVSRHALDMTSIMKASEELTTVPKSSLYLALGRALVHHAPPQAQRLPILNDVWKVVTKITDPVAYADIASVFVSYLFQNFSEREVNIFLKDVIKHLKTPDHAYKNVQPQLGAIVTCMMQHSQDLNKTLTMEHFLPILDLLDKQQKVETSKIVLTKFQEHGFNTSDPVIIHTLFDVARSCHDSIDSLSFDDERRQIGGLIISFIRRIDFGRDLEQQLNMYVECRQAFTSLDMVTQELVMRVSLLCMKAHRFMHGNHSKKTAAFVKACLAYAHITIPSLEDIFLKLRLLLVCGEVALVNGMIVQSEAFLKAAISLLPDVPPTIEVFKQQVSTEEELVSYVRNFASFLLLFPGHPEHGPFYLVKGLLNAIQTYEPWSAANAALATPTAGASGGPVAKFRIFLSVFSLFCTYFQRNFPYRIAKIESNDELYGGDPTYMKQLAPFLDTLVSEMLAQLSILGERTDMISKKHQAALALDLVNTLITSITMNAPSATLVVKLVGLASKNPAVDKKYIDATITHIQSKKGTWYAEIVGKIKEAK